MRNSITSASNAAGSGGRLEIRHYLIDRFPVSFQGGSAWSCQCREFAMTNGCRHTREAAGMREAQVRIGERTTRGAPALIDEIHAR